MKTLILYYSFEGDTKIIAESMAGSIGADLEEIRLAKKITNPNSFMKYFWLGKMLLRKELPEIEPVRSKIDEYDLIIIGTPVWIGSFSLPIKSLLNKNQIKGKDMAYFLCHGGGPGKAGKELEEALKGNKIIGNIMFKEPRKNEKEKQILEAVAWAKDIMLVGQSAFDG